MFIDEKGKLFGKISVIDIALIVLVAAAVAFVGIKFFGNGTDDSQQMECSYVVEIKDIKESSLEYIKEGDMLYDDKGAFMGVIEKTPKATPSVKVVEKNDGTFATAEVPGRVDVLVNIRGGGIKNANGFYLDGKVSLLLGTYRFFKDDDIDFTASVVEIND